MIVAKANNSRLAAALFATAIAGMIAAGSVRPADACGPYSPESALDMRVTSMFTAQKTTGAELARVWKLPVDQARHLRLGKNPRRAIRWSEIDGDTATALVEITEEIPETRGSAPTRATRLVAVTLASRGRWSWRPTSVKPATASQRTAVALANKLADATSILTAAGSAKRAKR